MDQKTGINLSDNYNIKKIGLDFPDENLKIRIHNRVIKRLRMGMIQEASKLHKNRLSYKRMRELGLEYRYLADLLQKKKLKDEFVKKLETEIWHYAKRQRTWFRKDKNIKWVNLPD